MAVVAQPAEQVSELLQNLKVDTPKQADNVTQEVLPTNDEESSDASGDASASIGTGDAASTNGIHEGSAGGMYYVGGMNGYTTPGYVYDYSHGGYEPPVGGEWDDYSRYIVDGVELQSPGVYGDSSGSVYMHATSFGYASQPSYSPYTPGTPVPTMGADGQLYGPQAFQYPSHLYQQPMSPGAQYMGSRPPLINSGDGATPGNGEPTPPGVDGKNGGPRPGYPAMALIPPHGPYSRGVLPLSIHGPGSQDVRYEGLRAGALSWADATKVPEGQQRPGIPAGMHSMASQQFSAPGVPAQPLRQMTPLQIHIQASQQSRNPSGLTSPNLGPGAVARGYPPLSGMVNGPNGPVRGRGMGNVSVDLRSNGRGGWVGMDKGKQRGRGGGPMSCSNGVLDPLNEQNRGPRTIRTRSQRATPGVVRHARGQGASSSGNGDVASPFANKEQYNKAEFVTNYEHAKFFVIKSYSEDDVHKSIKYNVWASTPVGNKRLDAAYLEASTKCNEDGKSCPVFLFFSVNASGQFCGVAEMTGPVDFSKSVDYWQQDKWNGRFPVTWHIIKDIPNCQFRHIILENNDNKPVTNSRDTQEVISQPSLTVICVDKRLLLDSSLLFQHYAGRNCFSVATYQTVKFEQGIGMLNIFKSFASKTSILDDFQFYENRQRALTEKRARQQSQQQHRQGGGRTGGNEFDSTPREGDSPQSKRDEVVEGVGAGKPVEMDKSEDVDGPHSASLCGHDDSGDSRPAVRSSSDESLSGNAEININDEAHEIPAEQPEQAGSGPAAEGERIIVPSVEKDSVAVEEQ